MTHFSVGLGKPESGHLGVGRIVQVAEKSRDNLIKPEIRDRINARN